MPRNDLEARKKISQSLMGTRMGQPSAGFCIDNGYMLLTGSTHPLARRGSVFEHRKVLYDAIGPGPHQCHWCSKTLEWGGRYGLQADHLDGDRLNNDPENLVPSCPGCNMKRSPKPLYRKGRVTVEDAEKIRESGLSLKEIAQEYGISVPYASQLRSGKRKSNGK